MILVFIPTLILELKYNFINTSEPVMLTVSSDIVKRDMLLPDGTSVWLNQNSEISYPEEFGSNRREVHLKGEALFEVTHSESKPFIIYPAEDLIIEVLGTNFNVRTSGETGEVTVYVVSGRVSFYEKRNEKEKMILTENEKGNFNELPERYTV